MNKSIIYIALITCILPSCLGGRNKTLCHYKIIYLSTLLTSITVTGTGKLEESDEGMKRLIPNNNEHAKLLAGFLNRNNSGKNSTGNPGNENFDLFVIESDDGTKAAPVFPSDPRKRKENSEDSPVWQRAFDVRINGKAGKIKMLFQVAPKYLASYKLIVHALGVMPGTTEGVGIKYSDSGTVRYMSGSIGTIDNEAAKNSTTDIGTSGNLLLQFTGVGKLAYSKGQKNYMLQIIAVGSSLGNKLVEMLKTGKATFIFEDIDDLNASNAPHYFSWPDAVQNQQIATTAVPESSPAKQTMTITDIVVESWDAKTKSIKFSTTMKYPPMA